MNIEEFRDFCLSLPFTTEECPFGPETLVFKVKGKMFALTSIDNYEYMNLKCDPELVEELRANHDAVRPGYHMNKKHWNSVYIDGTLTNDHIRDMVQHSYDQVVKKLTKKDRKEIEEYLEEQKKAH